MITINTAQAALIIRALSNAEERGGRESYDVISFRDAEQPLIDALDAIAPESKPRDASYVSVFESTLCGGLTKLLRSKVDTSQAIIHHIGKGALHSKIYGKHATCGEESPAIIVKDPSTATCIGCLQENIRIKTEIIVGYPEIPRDLLLGLARMHKAADEAFPACSPYDHSLADLDGFEDPMWEYVSRKRAPASAPPKSGGLVGGGLWLENEATELPSESLTQYKIDGEGVTCRALPSKAQPAEENSDDHL